MNSKVESSVPNQKFPGNMMPQNVDIGISKVQAQSHSGLPMTKNKDHCVIAVPKRKK